MAEIQLKHVYKKYEDKVVAVQDRENGGVAIGVLSGVSQEADFRGEEDYILNSVGELPQLLEQI